MNLNLLINDLIANQNGERELEYPPLCYIAGPMTSVFRRSEIDLLKLCRLASHVERYVRECGWLAINPYGSCLDPDNFTAPKELFIEGDLYMIALCDMMMLLPGWQASEGVTKYELPLAKGLGIEIIEWLGDGEFHTIQESRHVQPDGDRNE